MLENPFHLFDTFLFDGDGVLYKENNPLPGAIELFNLLKKEGKKTLLLTNNSTKVRADYIQKLSDMGITIIEEEVLTSSYLTAKYISEEKPKSRIYVIGEEGLKKELEKQNLEVANPGKETNDEEIFDFDFNGINIVVTGMDRKLNYVKMARAMNLLSKKDKTVEFIATNADITFPTNNGLIPGGGAMITVLEELSGRKISKIIGKPQEQMYLAALKISNTPKDKAIMFGDRIHTDIYGANQVGITSCLVLSGVTSKEDLIDLSDDLLPDIIVNNLQDVIVSLSK